ncbi:hypothetical protein WKW77_11675 [Variovorax ureilyticus]|uniref:Dolichyl-phosphate-mannose-protein mannosyltransferase n=1 Tax=Variovorax ureilyticus TaxID=1836198 RepID=A0ABU8VDJ2_9BURK
MKDFFVPGERDWGRIFGVAWLLVVAALSYWFVYQRGQDQNWDLLNYHYYAGYFLLHGRFDKDIAAAGLQGFLNPVANVLSYFALSSFRFPKSAWFILSVQLLSLPLLMLITRKIARDLGYLRFGWSEFLALSLGVIAPLWWSELGTTFFSSTTTPLVFLGLYLGLRFFEKETGVSVLISSGVFFGISVGLKMTNLPFAIGFWVALTIVSVGLEVSRVSARLTAFGGGLFLGFLATAWWNLYLLYQWKSPVFPLYNTIFRSPYYEATNYQDPRWRFGSMWEFFRFIVESSLGTSKTSEVAFSDPRLAVALVMLIAIIFARRKFPIGKEASVFSFFFLISFAIWSLMFAYQRYIIPLELLFGPLILVWASQLTSNRVRVAQILAGCVILAVALVRVPDWGHLRNPMDLPNSFDLRLPEKISSTPANYLVYGVPNSFILPFLHKDSNFYKIDFSGKTEGMIRDRIRRESQYPLRILTNQSVASSIPERLSRFGYVPSQTNLDCSSFESGSDRFVVCEVTSAIQAGRN